ncbi:MAG: UDP-N-acetylglucosamine 1-carboxyvinyltransferase [Candidatus Kerfeldbacteria bacterium RIFCSPHIGHO2_02_FULL_42_14]|uniref:UDP-N-acetylglucosamine 1-carboxyvinyltransferase n=1 Tax=Candidatus Kerfeldbacteria bacterium RIFCSPHIGHO2_02_FULL_42_14 TaxID=1798540 RepID=A0A1G2AQY3_9BACT|nr:MAG: UDP-N-acetylglucosamine 1-carboxyvinyltransferase [Candidatus Kerfeldbacteria bacterium RIFCSPHIGHO2_02_FULL_42_14]OGY81772.1 MAG: UDP-N-acetylglucosamine 1-carboxyvinyltransferase [Candidatus Kerfeldbacteria bacterium RIFCSPHIGHO2_12_FULL_42_13]OGY84461.1 MAG: UDP-N-acetylglucosamine 1-carboxyvinyltransferase [Candidatus Kerfeldbacteria bacterium RIFCSPLOWO2_02_FULL_42_19]OGY87998.1 MAG: UDP-N-acetylglucosamine 1-carboxyvinyltransferase [Candidatus Kerfeldbacteria bacterium RIFCSPLOWO2_
MSQTRKRIGKFITLLRTQRGMTQKDFAIALKTSQSAIARIEKGEQNLSMDMLEKIGNIFGKNIVTLASGAINFRIEGGHKLHGTIVTNTSKNAAVALLCASLLNKNVTRLKNMPRIEEIHRIIEVLASIGTSVKWQGNDLEIKPPKKLVIKKMNLESAQKTRSVIMLLGPLIHWASKFRLPQPGGCKLGSRTIRPHLYALESLGVRMKKTVKGLEVRAERLTSREIVLYEAGDTVTENIMMAAAKIPGITTIKFASANYQVQDLCFFLEKLGVKIEGIGTTTLRIHGKKEINTPITYYPAEDPIESMFFLSAAITTQSSITIQRCPIDFLELELLKLEKMGAKFQLLRRYVSRNGHTRLVDIKTLPAKLHALEDKIHPQPYPGLNIDNLPFFIPIATQAEGRTLIHDWVYENRMIYAMEMTKLNAKIMLVDPHRLSIEGPIQLQAAEIICPPALRIAAIILIAMLAARGVSLLRNVYSINRGYEDICKRLQNLGAHIELIQSFD